MEFSRPDADLFVPDGEAMPAALARTTHLCIGAHQDDQEFMALHGILECFRKSDKWFTGVCLTNGGGSSRTGPYERYTNEDMIDVRRGEQRKAAAIGEYACEIQLMHPSSHVKDASNTDVVEDLRTILAAARPGVVYLHNPADKHDTHVAAVLRSITALRALPEDARPVKIYGCEIWRSLDWLCDGDKQVMDVDSHRNLAAALSGVFDSQIIGGKRYDAANMGRQAANATFFESHAVDTSGALSWAMDLTPLAEDASLPVGEYVAGFLGQFRKDVMERISTLS